MLDQSASQKAALWLSGFADALSRGDAEEAAGQFAGTCFWRDLVAFSWNIVTFEGRDAIAATLRDALPRTRPSHWAVEGEASSADGVIGHEAGSSTYIHVPAVPVELVDATGGGDSFCGGLLAGYTESRDATSAMISGVVSASFCVEGLGLSELASAPRDDARQRADLLRNRVGRHTF